MSWMRLYVTVEGEAELKFANDTLKTHLVSYEVAVKPRMVLTNRKLGKRGGVPHFQKLKQDLLKLMKEDKHTEARFTTMMDLYALPSDYPGWQAADRNHKPADRVAALEQALAKEVPDPRFMPYLQLHEFEALLYCDLSKIASRIPDSGKAITRLTNEVGSLLTTPEDINEGNDTAPSKRLIRHLPLYERLKVRVGAPAAAEIGLANIRAKCPHFDQWVSRLEKLSAGTA